MDNWDRQKSEYFSRKAKHVPSSTRKRKTSAEIFKKELKERKVKIGNYLDTTEWMYQMTSEVSSEPFLPNFL